MILHLLLLLLAAEASKCKGEDLEDQFKEGKASILEDRRKDVMLRLLKCNDEAFT